MEEKLGDLLIMTYVASDALSGDITSPKIVLCG